MTADRCAAQNARTGALLAAILAILLAPIVAFGTVDPVFDAKGFSPTREFEGELPFEHVDPLTGNLLLTFTDLVLPGNAGFDLKIQRSYNIKIYSYYDNVGTYIVDPAAIDPMGLGWTLHFGRVRNLTFGGAGVRPIIDMPDGSSHTTLSHIAEGVNQTPQKLITRELWTLDRFGEPHGDRCPDVVGCPLLRLPNGVRYVFAHGNTSAGPLYATDISDSFGNSLHVEYEPYIAGEPAYVKWVDQKLKTTETRRVSFSYLPPLSGSDPFKRLHQIGFGNHTWTYAHTSIGSPTDHHTVLTSVQMPEGLTWSFDYHGVAWPKAFLLQKVTTPDGGWVQYDYTGQAFAYGSTEAYTPVVSNRTQGGTGIPTGTWSYAFTQPGCTGQPCWATPVRATVTAPCHTTTYETYALEVDTDPLAWRIGSMKTKTIVGGGASQTETYAWIASEPISKDTEGGPPPAESHRPLLSERTLTRDGASYVTTHTYHATEYGDSRSFNDYGNPETTVEVMSGDGQVARTTTRTFYQPSPSDLSLGNYISGKVKTEDVTVAGESFTRSYDYATTGFLKTQTIYGVTTTFTADAGGNVASAKDANNKITGYAYTNGVLRQIRTPMYTIDRSINADGTIAWEQRGSNINRTTFTYDDLFRLTLHDPPLGSSIVTTYATDATNGSSVTVARGTAYSTTKLDGFGRSLGTVNSVGIRTDGAYDACGRLTTSTYPHTGTSGPVTTYTYDGLSRLKTRQNPDHTSENPSTVNWTYSASGSPPKPTVAIEDEENRTTTQVWQAFGDPEDRRLLSVTDAQSKTTSYGYNALGMLTSVTHPDGYAGRTWVYNTKNQLESETQPESGTITYTYHPVGTVKTRTDAQFGTTTFSYDGNNRLIKVDRPVASAGTSIAYNVFDSRTSLVRGAVLSKFDYDSANRLEKRTDTVSSRDFVTRFGYDDRDNLDHIDYPSGGHAKYTYDNGNRITSVTNGGGSGGVTFADQFAYHPSGAIASYRAGNLITHSATYDPNRYWVRSVANSGVSINYNTYDLTGNLKTFSDSRLGSVSLTYDNVDRLFTANASSTWGSLGFTYDALGNRKTLTQNAANTSYTYNTTSHRLGTVTPPPPASAISYSYDLNGNVTSDGPGRTYTYDANDMLATATVDGATTTYRYDGDGLRKVKIDPTDTRYFIHGPGGQILSEFVATSAGPQVERDYVYAGTRLLASVRPPVLGVTPLQLTFAAVADGAGAPAQTVTVDGGGSVIAWQATPSAAWLSVSPSSGSTPATVTVSVNHAGLPVGSYAGTISFTSAGAAGSPRIVTVRLVVLATPGLAVGPASFRFRAFEGMGNPFAQALDVLYAGGGSVSWSATYSAPWLQASPASGTTPATAQVSVDTTGLARGTYRDFITVAAPGAQSGSPKIVPVELVVQAGPGASCTAGYHYCEPFDGLDEGTLDGQGGWQSVSRFSGVVSADPRGIGKALLLDAPPPDQTIIDQVDVTDYPIEGSEIEMQVMSRNTSPDSPQVAKIEFQTSPPNAWGKTGRTYGALRFGSKLYLQYGPNIYRVLVDQMESERWYDVRVVYARGQIEAYVDGELLFTTTNPLDPGLQLPHQTFVTSAWDLAGSAYIDLIEARAAQPGLVVIPHSLSFTHRLGSLADAPAAAANPAIASPVAARRAAQPSLPMQVAREALAKLPLRFEPNQGQAGPGAQFVARGPGFAASFAPSEAVLGLGARHAAPGGGVIHMRFDGADPGVRLAPSGAVLSRSHYFRGRDPQRWAHNVPQYPAVRYEGLYPGIDAVFYGHGGDMEYDFVVAPGADAGQIRLVFDGAADVALDPHGALLIKAPSGAEVKQHAPLAFQERDGVRVPVTARYVVQADRRVSFEVGSYDAAQPLFIDPVLTYSTYFGGSGTETLGAMLVDSDGYIYVAGSTNSIDFPVVGAVQPEIGSVDGPEDAFVAKLDPSGQSLVFSTYLGGPLSDLATGLALDPAGNVYVAGQANEGFPIVGGTWSFGGGWDPFLAKLSADGSELLFSRYVDGTDENEVGVRLTRLSTGEVVVAWTHWKNIVTESGTYLPPRVRFDILTDGGAWQAWFYPALPTGIDLRAMVGAVAADDIGGFGLTGSIYDAPGGTASLSDAFFLNCQAGSCSQFFSKRWGGSDADVGLGIAAGRIAWHVVGYTRSPDFPTHHAVQPNLSNSVDGFLTRIIASPTAKPQMSTYLDGWWWPFWEWDEAAAVAVDRGDPADDRVYVTGTSVYEGQVPWVKSIVGASSANPAVAYSAWLHVSNQYARASAIAVNPAGGVVVAGETNDAVFPVVNPFQSSLGGETDAFIAKLSGASAALASLSFVSASYSVMEPDGPGTPRTLTITVARSGNLDSYVTVDYTTADGTATSADYQPTSGRLTFEPGQVQAAFDVTILHDYLEEPEEWFTVLLGNASAGATVGTPSSAPVTIVDNDRLARTLQILDRILPSGPNWTAQDDTPWLTLSQSSGTGPSTITATVDPSGLPLGTYTGTIVVTGDTGNSPQVVDVTLQVVP